MSEPTENQRYEGRIGDWIIEKNHQFIIFNKPAGLPVQPDTTDDLALSQMGSAYARTGLQPVHRLDRPVSGLVIMSKKASAQTAITKQFKNEAVEKTYLAIVGERPEKDEDTLVDFILEQGGKRNRSSIAAADIPKARRAELSYRYLGGSDRYHLLEVKPKTGRKHQIRLQLANIGSPLRGDTKYGFKRAQEGGLIDLHSWKISFDHPVSLKRLSFTAPVPNRPVWEGMKELIEK